MSEHWKSTPKYWCKHCSTFIRDTPFERKQHESTARHQNNLKRFLRDIQNDHERGEREKQKAKVEVERLNRLTGSGPTTQSRPPLVASASHKEKSGPRTADDQKRQWQQLADMGIKVPEHARAEMAMVGDWESFPEVTIEEAPEESLSIGIRKRKLEGEDEDGEEPSKSLSTRKVWGKSVKALAVDNERDLDALLSTGISLKKTEEEFGYIAPKRESVNAVSVADADEAPNPGRSTTTTQDTSDNQKPAPSEGARRTARSLADSTATGLVKSEAADVDDREPASENIAEADPAPFFKKRKAKAKAVK